MTVDYKQLKSFVKEAIAMNSGDYALSSGPVGVPHRMPAADNREKEQDRGDPRANELYEQALKARAATEDLVEALDEPIFDDAYEHAFKASACLRRALNSLESAGAHPTPEQRVVAPPSYEQPYAGSVSYMPLQDLGEQEDLSTSLQGFGSKVMSKSAHATAKKKVGAAIGSGKSLQGVEPKERAMLQQIEQILTNSAEKIDLTVYRPWLKTMFATLLKKVEAGSESGDTSK